jgi:MFS transporter, DHA2 family, multidrug resistance protein
VFPERERPRALAGWAAVAATALAAGPVVGGLVTTLWGWQAVFLLNLPVAVAAMIGFHRVVPESRDDDPAPFDPIGTVLVTVAASALVITGTSLGERSGATVPLIACAVAVLGLVAFVRRQGRAPRPMVDLSLYTDRRFVGASLAVTALALGTGTALFSLTQYLQLVLGYPPLLAGAAMVPLAAGSIVGAVAGGRLPDLLGSHRVVALGLVVTGAGFLLLVPGSGGGYPVVAVALLLGGLGTGLAGPAASAAVLGAAPPERAGLASALHDTHQQLGVAFGIAALGSVLAGLYRSGLPGVVPQPAAGSPSTTLDWARESGTPEAIAWVRDSFSGAQAVTMGIGGACALVGAAVALATLRGARAR